MRWTAAEFLQPRLSLGQTSKKKLLLIFRVRFSPYQTNKQAIQNVSKDMTEEVTGKRREHACNTFLSAVPPQKSKEYELLSRASLKKETLISPKRHHRKNVCIKEKHFIKIGPPL